MLNGTEKTFNKKSHRPWKPNLLEKALQSPSENKSNTNITTERTVSLNSIGTRLQSTIQEKTEERKKILEEITNKNKSPMLIGGFFQPNCMTLQDNNIQDKKINNLVSDLKNREHEIYSLTNDLKIAQAIELAEQRELARKMEEQAKLAAEERMKQAIEQAHSTAKQFHLAMEKANQAETLQQEEAEARKAAEDNIEEALVYINNLQLALEKERQAKTTAEEKAQYALNQTVQIELSRQETEKNFLQEKTSLLAASSELEIKNKELLDKINNLENQINEEIKQRKIAEEKFNPLLEQHEKLQNILQSEKELRKLSEQKIKEALEKITQLELAKHSEEKQRRLIEERARRAITHASKTVMHFLNAPFDGIDYELSEEINKDINASENQFAEESA